MIRKNITLRNAAIVSLLFVTVLSLGACSGTSRIAVGAVFTTLPHGHTAIVVGGSRYFYSDGYYYRPVRSGYRVVAAPVGAVIAYLPRQHKVVRVHGNIYHAYRGTYYRWDPQRKVYLVVTHPL